MGKRRTRKDKIIAQLRRQVGDNPIQSTSAASFGFSEVSTPASLEQQPDPPASTISELSLFSYDVALVRKDLVKTFILASLAFGIEIGLYLVWH